MPKLPKLPAGTGVYKDTNGEKEIFRVRLGTRFLGEGRKPFRKAFSSQGEAVAFIRDEDQKRLGNPIAAESIGMSPQEIVEAKYGLSLLKKFNQEGMFVTLTDAVEAWIRLVAPFAKSPTVSDAIETLVKSKKAENLTKRHTNETKAKLKRIFYGLEAVKISEVSEADMENSMIAPDADDNEPSISQKRKRIRYSAILFNFAIKKNWILKDRSPIKGISKPKYLQAPPHVLTLKEVASLLWTAQQYFPDMVQPLAIKIFSGVRNPELFALKWSWIHEGKGNSGTIIVDRAHSKTKKTRSVSIRKNLAVWLESRGEGLVLKTPPDIINRELYWLTKLREIRIKAGYENWPQNCLRHCFGSYHYQLEKNEARTAYEMGNSPAIVRAYYTNGVEQKACERFWAMLPSFTEAISTEDTTPMPHLEEPPEPQMN